MRYYQLASLASVLLAVQARLVTVKITADSEYDFTVGPVSISSVNSLVIGSQVYDLEMPEGMNNIRVHAKSTGKYRGLIASFSVDGNVIETTDGSGRWTASNVDPSTVRSFLSLQQPVYDVCDANLWGMSQFDQEVPVNDFAPTNQRGPETTFPSAQWIWPGGCQRTGSDEAWFSFDLFVPAEPVMYVEDPPICIEGEPCVMPVPIEGPPGGHHGHHGPHGPHHMPPFSPHSFMAGVMVGFMFLIVRELFAYLRFRSMFGRHHGGHHGGHHHDGHHHGGHHHGKPEHQSCPPEYGKVSLTEVDVE